jgi:signal peptidase I
MSRFFRQLGLFFLDFVEVIVTSFALFVVVYLLFLQPHQVRGDSMLPNFHNNEYLLTDKITYRFRDPRRGEVVVFQAPGNERFDYIKRIIGLPGEKVRIENGDVYINNQLIDEVAYLHGDNTSGGSFLNNGEQIIVPENQYFVLGDNRDGSHDSRAWGFVPEENIIGKAWFRYWPIDELGFIPKASY